MSSTNTRLKICKNFLTGLRTQFASPQQGILLGVQDRNGSIVTNTVKCIIPYISNEQELVTLLATYMNHKGLSIIGWILVTDRESSYQRIAQSYFETFTSAILKVLIANCATINAHHPSSNPRLIAEEAADLLQNMTGILIFDGIKHSASTGDFISSGFFGFYYPITAGEIVSKIMSMDQIMHDLPCDPVEHHILSEFQSGLSGNPGEDRMDVGLLESLALSAAAGSSFPGKKFRSRRNASNPNSAASSLLAMNNNAIDHHHHHQQHASLEDVSSLQTASGSNGTGNSNQSAAAANEDSFYFLSGQNANASSSSEASALNQHQSGGKAKATLMPESDVEILFGSGSGFIQDSLHSSPLLYSQYDQEHFASCCALQSTESFLEEIVKKQAILMQHTDAVSKMLEAYEGQCREVEQLMVLWKMFSQ